jgi:choline dehydrogenase
MTHTEAFDYIIVGAGSAGCVLADRLSAAGHSVVVLEFGGSDRSVFIQMPSALAIPMNRKKYNWHYESEPEPHLGGRRLHTPRGKGLGGSSSINGLVYVRGNPLDFERWQDEGAAGWNYASVLPYFKRAQRHADGGDEYRGSDGPLDTRYGPQPALSGVDRCGGAGWLSGDGRRQRRAARRLWPGRHDRA